MFDIVVPKAVASQNDESSPVQSISAPVQSTSAQPKGDSAAGKQLDNNKASNDHPTAIQSAKGVHE